MGKQYDLIVIGSGPAGHAAAIMAAQKGMKAVIVEKSAENLGGVCLNEGCIPAKSMFHSAEIIDHARDHEKIFDVKKDEWRINYKGILDKSREAVEKLKKGLKFVLEKNNIDILIGTGTFKDNVTVCVLSPSGEETDIKAGKVIIAAGSKPKTLAGIEFDGKKIVTSSDIMSLDVLPEDIAIVGAGAIGVEFASFFDLLGSKVTLIEAERTILPLEDLEAAGALSGIFRRRGIKIKTGYTVKSLKVKGEKVEAVIAKGDEVEKTGHDLVLISAGRVPSVSELGLEAAGVRTDKDGFIEVDEKFQTNVENIYAAGDVIRTPMLAHVASAEGEHAVKSFMGEKTVGIEYSYIPNAVYSRIKVASAGATEEALKKEGVKYNSGKQYFRANGRAVLSGADQGFIKILAHADTRVILGVHIVGYAADEMIHEFVLALRNRLTVEAVSDMVHAHPTFSESAVQAARSVFGDE